jgi:hypothetical protein
MNPKEKAAIATLTFGLGGSWYPCSCRESVAWGALAYATYRVAKSCLLQCKTNQNARRSKQGTSSDLIPTQLSTISTKLNKNLTPHKLVSTRGRTWRRRSRTLMTLVSPAFIFRDDSCLVVRLDGSQQTYNRPLIQHAFNDYTTRLKNFFAYLGPDYRGPGMWRYNAYILYKGWTYGHSLGHITPNAQLQKHWADRFIHLSDINKLTALLPI